MKAMEIFRGQKAHSELYNEDLNASQKAVEQVHYAVEFTIQALKNFHEELIMEKPFKDSFEKVKEKLFEN